MILDTLDEVLAHVPKPIALIAEAVIFPLDDNMYISTAPNGICLYWGADESGCGFDIDNTE